MEYKICENTDGMTVLQVLKNELGLSHAFIKHLKFKENGITINGEHVTVRRIVKKNDVLCLLTEDEITPEKLTPSDLGLNIAYENDDLVIPDKPANMPTHQSFGHYGDTVANALTYRYASKGIPFVFRSVNRLDRNTSGLLLIARNRISAAFLADAMKRKEITKQYIAILKGVLKEDEGVIDTYMRRTAQSVIVREVCDENGGGDRAITHFRVICRSDTHTMVTASPITGRTHQLRVHFAYLGCPIEGDDMYGSASDMIDRHALHSYLLTLPLPDGSESITVTAPLHEDMAILAHRVFGDRLNHIEKQIKDKILIGEKPNEI